MRLPLGTFNQQQERPVRLRKKHEKTYFAHPTPTGQPARYNWMHPGLAGPYRNPGDLKHNLEA